MVEEEVRLVVVSLPGWWWPHLSPGCCWSCVASRVWLYSTPVQPARHAAAAAVPALALAGPTPSTGKPLHPIGPWPAHVTPANTAGIFANSYWQLVRRRPEILQTFYTESRRMKFCEIDQCWVSSMSQFRAQLREGIGVKLYGEGPHPVRTQSDGNNNEDWSLS